MHFCFQSFCETCLSRILWRKGELFGTYLKLTWNLHHLEFGSGQDLSINVIIIVWQIERQFTSLRCTTLSLWIVNLERYLLFKKRLVVKIVKCFFYHHQLASVFCHPISKIETLTPQCMMPHNNDQTHFKYLANLMQEF